MQINVNYHRNEGVLFMSGERRAESGEQKITRRRAPRFEFWGIFEYSPKHLANLRILLVKFTKFRHVDELQPVIYFQFQGIMMQDLVLLMKELFLLISERF